MKIIPYLSILLFSFIFIFHDVAGQASINFTKNISNSYSNTPSYSNNYITNPILQSPEERRQLSNNLYSSKNDIFFNQTETIKASDYCVFLNATSSTDSLENYLNKMGNDSEKGCIIRQGPPDNYYYTLIAGREDMPVAYLSLNNAARYYSWLKKPSLFNDLNTDNEETTLQNLDCLNITFNEEKISSNSLEKPGGDIINEIDPFISSNAMNFEIIVPASSIDSSSIKPKLHNSNLQKAEQVALDLGKFILGNLAQETIEILIAQMLGWLYVPVIILACISIYMYSKSLGLGFISHALTDLLIWGAFQYFHINLPSLLYQQLEKVGLEFIATPFIKAHEAIDSLLHYYGVEHSHLPIATEDGTVTYQCPAGCVHPKPNMPLTKPTSLKVKTPKTNRLSTKDFICAPCTTY